MCRLRRTRFNNTEIIMLELVQAKIDPELKEWLDTLGDNRSETIRKALWYYYRVRREFERELEMMENKKPR